MKNSLNKYKIGLLVVGVFTLGMAGYVMIQAGAAKEDNETYKKATKIADKLNDYTLRKSPPASLQAAGIQDVPDSVSYTRLSSTRYKFCVTYKADSSGFDASSVENQLLSSAYGTDSSYNYDDYESSYLYLDYTHHKGENCKTIKSYSSSIYDDPYYDETYNSDLYNSTQDSTTDSVSN